MPQPFIKFYPRDWIADQGLAQCSMGAQGWWLRMMVAMHSAARYGFFELPKGGTIDVALFARANGQNPRDVERWIAELETQDVFSRDDDGTIYCRRMRRDGDRYARNRQNAKAGGNPALIAFRLTDSDNRDLQSGLTDSDNRDLQSGLTDSDNRDLQSGLTDSDNPHAGAGDREARSQKPEARDTDSLRSSALAVRTWPADAAGLRPLALLFLRAHGNCFDAVKAERHMPTYVAVLAAMRSRGVTIAEAWHAFAEASIAAGRPLFGGLVKTAMSFLPSRTMAAEMTPNASDLLPTEFELDALARRGAP